MATEILTNIAAFDFIPTSRMTNVRASTSKSKVAVSLSCYVTSGQVVFFSTWLYASDGIVTLSDVGSLVEDFFRRRRLVIDEVEVRIDNATVSGRFLYCEYGLPESFDPENSFLIASSVRSVHQDSLVSVAAMSRGESVPYVIKAVGHRSDGSLAVVSKTVPRQTVNQLATEFSVVSIIEWALNMTDEETGDDIVDVIQFTIGYGDLKEVCYLRRDAAYLTFSFFNIFNVREFVDVSGVMVTKSVAESEMAVANGRAYQYDRSLSRSFEVTTGPLSHDDFAVFEQFLSSPEVSVFVDGEEHDVLITDSKCERSSDDLEQSVVTFTWRFAENRPRLFNHEFNGILPTRRKIFTQEFTPEYE